MRDRHASYPIQLPVHYRMREGDPVTGEGRTLTMGRETLRFSCDQPLPENQKIQLVVGWPAKLPGGANLNVWILGTITRCAAGRVEVRIGTFEFRTRRVAQSANTPHGGDRAGIRTLTAGS